MLKFSADLHIHRPVDKVFTWLTTAQNHAKFDKTSLEMELLTPSPWQAGSQFREVRDLGGRKTEVFSEIIDFETNKRFVLRSKTGPDFLGTWRFEPEGTGTHLQWTGQMTMKGLRRLLEPLIGSQMRPQIDQQFSALPKLLESEISAH
ncbi:MAG: SRPBCC family protein [Anaerolineales bacterium]